MGDIIPFGRESLPYCQRGNAGNVHVGDRVWCIISPYRIEGYCRSYVRPWEGIISEILADSMVVIYPIFHRSRTIDRRNFVVAHVKVAHRSESEALYEFDFVMSLRIPKLRIAVEGD